jgi:hypothetical protein
MHSITVKNGRDTHAISVALSGPVWTNRSPPCKPVIGGDLPVILAASNAREIKRVIAFAEEFQLKYLIAGASQAYEVADLLKAKNARVLLSLNYPQRPTNIEDPNLNRFASSRNGPTRQGCARAFTKRV